MTRNTDDVELNRLEQLPIENASQRELIEQNFEPAGDYSRVIPPADGGKEAWLFLAACFMVEGLVWGFPYSFGIFQQYYSTHEPFASSGNIAVIGTFSMGIMYLDAPLLAPVLKKWPQLRRPFAVAGLLTMCLAVALASFAKNTAHLVLTQGILYSIGGSIVYYPAILFVNEWFITRKGLAFGIMWAGTGVAGVVLPLILQWLLDSYGFRTTLRIWSITLFILTAPLLYFLKPRLPLSQTSRQHSPNKLYDLSFLTSSHFLILQACNIIEGFGYFLPTIYIPSFAQQQLHSSSLGSAFTIISINIASVFGTIFMGMMIDRLHVTTCILISTLGATLGIFLIWGFATSLAPLYLFCIVYGLFAGSFSSTWTGIIRHTQEKAEGADAGLVFAILASGRGIGNVVSGPLSEVLVKGKPWIGEAGMGYGTGYGLLIVFTGISALLGGSSFVVRRVGWM